MSVMKPDMSRANSASLSPLRHRSRFPVSDRADAWVAGSLARRGKGDHTGTTGPPLSSARRYAGRARMRSRKSVSRG